MLKADDVTEVTPVAEKTKVYPLALVSTVKVVNVATPEVGVTAAVPPSAALKAVGSVSVAVIEMVELGVKLPPESDKAT
jgi:hypothetical protein